MRPRAFRSKTPSLSSIVLSHSCRSHSLTDTQIISRLWIVALALVSCQLRIYVSVRMTGRAVMNIVRLRDGAPLSDSIILSIRVTDLKVAATVSQQSRGPVLCQVRRCKNKVSCWAIRQVKVSFIQPHKQSLKNFVAYHGLLILR